jgi:hypothetical protein
MNASTKSLVTWVVIFGLLILAAFLAGCGGTEAGNPDSSGAFVDDSALESYIKEEYASAVVPAPGTSSYPNFAADVGERTGTDGDEAPRDFSQTNVQESGVDESDKVKTDGHYLYVAPDRAVQIVHLGDGGTMEAVASVAVGGAIDSLYLYGAHLVVLYSPAGDQPTEWCGRIEPLFVGGVGAAMPCWIPTRAETGVLIVDVADPDQPAVVRDIVFDGNLVTSRRIGARLHLVTQFVPDLPPLEPFYNEAVESKEAVVARNRDALAEVDLDALIPSFTSRNSAGEVIDSGRLITTENFLRPSDAEGGSETTVMTIDLDAPEAEPASVAALLDVRHVYASTTALYLAAEHYHWGADTVDFYSTTSTTLHKYDLTGDQPVFAGSDTVSGTLLNRYSLGEYQGVLRVATTTGATWDGSARTHVFCLQEGSDGLETIGRLDDLAPGERLYAARFLGPRGFLVTFVKIDPLFTLDLSDPTQPRVAGELKVPGYSDYIHPVGNDYLLTIGKDAVPEGDFAWYQGLQLSLFDVRDFAHPQLLHVEKIGDRGSESEALYDPKAFTYWPDHDLLALPVDLYQHTAPPQHPSQYGTYAFSGLYVYRVTADTGFTLLGRITTTGEVLPPTPAYGGWTRGLFVGPTVYAVTPDAIRSAAIDDIADTVRTLSLGE